MLPRIFDAPSSLAKSSSNTNMTHEDSMKGLDVKDFWYSIQEISSFKRRDRHIVRLMEDYYDDNNNNTGCIARLISYQDDSIDGHCTRGLEGRTRQAQNRRRCTREAAQFSVFQEQAQQCNAGSSWSFSSQETEDAIAIRYRQLSEQSQRYAYDRALKDEQNVLELFIATSDAKHGSMTLATTKTTPCSPPPPPPPQRRLAQGVRNSPTVPSPRQLSMLIVACLAA
jgi:hypothetical protein